MGYMKNEEAQACAEKYRDQIMELLRAKGYVIRNGKGWGDKINYHVFIVEGEPEVEFSLEARSATRDHWSASGYPDLEFRPGYGSNRRITHWREPPKGWTEKTAEKHAATLDEFIKETRQGRLADRDNALRRGALEKQADAMNKRLGIKDQGAFYASHDGRRVIVSIRPRHLDVPEDKVEELLLDLHVVLKRYGVK
jgi:hypothetical protein